MDAIGEALVSDYLIPVMLILGLMWLWFSTDEPASSGLLAKKTVIAAILAMAFANLAVLVLNEVYFRPRPFTEVELNLLFYRPTDSSFPSNPAALSFALAFSVLQRQSGLGLGAHNPCHYLELVPSLRRRLLCHRRGSRRSHGRHHRLGGLLNSCVGWNPSPPRWCGLSERCIWHES